MFPHLERERAACGNEANVCVEIESRHAESLMSSAEPCLNLPKHTRAAAEVSQTMSAAMAVVAETEAAAVIATAEEVLLLMSKVATETCSEAAALVLSTVPLGTGAATVDLKLADAEENEASELAHFW